MDPNSFNPFCFLFVRQENRFNWISCAEKKKIRSRQYCHKIYHSGWIDIFFLEILRRSNFFARIVKISSSSLGLSYLVFQTPEKKQSYFLLSIDLITWLGSLSICLADFVPTEQALNRFQFFLWTKFDALIRNSHLFLVAINRV